MKGLLFFLWVHRPMKNVLTTILNPCTAALSFISMWRELEKCFQWLEFPCSIQATFWGVTKENTPFPQTPGDLHSNEMK